MSPTLASIRIEGEDVRFRQFFCEFCGERVFPPHRIHKRPGETR